ncbi:MAG: RNA methyltransferase [Candidatus Undinarchaeales archaeon]
MKINNISVILDQPLYQGNIGSVARAMKNFGLSKLVLIGETEIGEEARKMAVHAQDVLKNAEKIESFEKTVKNFDLVIGTSSEKTDRDDYFLRMSLTPEEMREKIEKTEGELALVFGKEDIGLTNEQLELCDFVVNIPTSSEYKTMNLSHSAAVLFYELFKFEEKETIRLAGRKEKDIIYEKFEEILEKTDYTEDKIKIFISMLRKILGRANLTGREASTLIGVLKEIDNRRWTMDNR